jgi:phage baseplate assembly protein W
MALSPIAQLPRVEITEPVTEPSRTYDLFTTQMRSTVDGDDALRQFIRKALLTARTTYLIYDNQYGNEIDTLIGQNVNNALFDAEIVRMVREALIYDDRVTSVSNFVITRSADACFVTFDVATLGGSTITEEVTI